MIYVIRHGSNAANQSMTQWMVLDEIEGTIPRSPRRRAEILAAWMKENSPTVYNNQHLSIEGATWCHKHGL